MTLQVFHNIPELICLLQMIVVMLKIAHCFLQQKINRKQNMEK